MVRGKRGGSRQPTASPRLALKRGRGLGEKAPRGSRPHHRRIRGILDGSFHQGTKTTITTKPAHQCGRCCCSCSILFSCYFRRIKLAKIKTEPGRRYRGHFGTGRYISNTSSGSETRS